MGRGKHAGCVNRFIPVSDIRSRPAPSGLDAPEEKPFAVDQEKFEKLRNALYDGCTPEDIGRIGLDLKEAIGYSLVGVWDGKDQYGMSGDVTLLISRDEEPYSIPARLWMFLQDFDEERPEIEEIIAEMEGFGPGLGLVKETLDPELRQYDKCNWYWPDD